MWLAGLPSAGAKPPVWQVEHCAATGCWVWFQRLGFHVAAVAVWQAMQLAVVGMCVVVLPEALAPLWQLLQAVATVKVAWLGLPATVQLVGVVWQAPQAVAGDVVRIEADGFEALEFSIAAGEGAA